MFWGGSRSTKPCVFPCKVAAGDDERYLVCATVAAAVGLSFFLPHTGTRWVETSFGEMRKFELRSDDMKIAKKNLADIWEDMK